MVSNPVVVLSIEQRTTGQAAGGSGGGGPAFGQPVERAPQARGAILRRHEASPVCRRQLRRRPSRRIPRRAQHGAVRNLVQLVSQMAALDLFTMPKLLWAQAATDAALHREFQFQ